MSGSLVLGIETSCDETGVGLVRVGDAGNELLVDAIASSVDEHARFGGIIPEVASRAHLEAMVPTLQRALAEAEVELGDVDAIAVTAGPGLVGPFPERCLALVVSGGHSSLLLVDDIATGVTELGQTLDDAAGEAFDKVGRLLGLPYPGGPHIDRLAQQGAVTIRFPRGLTAAKDQAAHAYDFSFSGPKTAVARWVEARQDAGEEVPLPDVAASFAEAVADVLTAKTVAACRRLEVDTLVIGGGFSANSQLRAMAQERCAAAGITVRIPPIRFCTDNGAMIAALGAAVLRRGVPASRLDLPVDSSMPLTRITV